MVGGSWLLKEGWYNFLCFAPSAPSSSLFTRRHWYLTLFVINVCNIFLFFVTFFDNFILLHFIIYFSDILMKLCYFHSTKKLKFDIYIIYIEYWNGILQSYWKGEIRIFLIFVQWKIITGSCFKSIALPPWFWALINNALEEVLIWQHILAHLVIFKISAPDVE